MSTCKGYDLQRQPDRKALKIGFQINQMVETGLVETELCGDWITELWLPLLFSFSLRSHSSLPIFPVNFILFALPFALNTEFPCGTLQEQYIYL